MPQLLTVRVTRPNRRPIRIWVPVVPVVLLFSPLVLLVVLAMAVACVRYGVGVPRALGTGWRFICALPGTRVDIDDEDMGFRISIR